MEGNIFIDIPKSGFPRKIQEVPVFQEKYVCNLKETIQTMDTLFLNEKIKKELETRLKKIHTCMENILKAGEFTTRSAGEILEEYYEFLSFILCTDNILYSSTFVDNILKPLLFIGVTIHRMDVYAQLYSFPVLTALYASYAYTELEDDLFLQNIFLKLFPSNILRYCSTLAKTATESNMLPKPSGTYVHFIGILPEHTAEKIMEAILSHIQKNNAENTFPIVVFVCGPCDEKQILKTTILTETLLKKEGCFLQTKLVFIIPEHLPLPDISEEILKKDTHSGIVSVSIKHLNIFCSPDTLKEALNNCDIVVLAGVSTILSIQEEPVSNMLVLRQFYCLNSFGKTYLQNPQVATKNYIELYGILLTAINSNIRDPKTMLEISILQTANRNICGGNVRAKNTLFLSGPEVTINNDLFSIVWEDTFTESFFCSAFHEDSLTEIPVYANDNADIIFPLFRFIECVPEAVQFTEHIVEKYNLDSIYINVTCNHEMISWNFIITKMESTEYKTKMYSSCNPSSSENMDNLSPLCNLLLSVYRKKHSCYEDFRRSQLSSLLYTSCRSIAGLVFCRKLETKPEEIIMQTKEICFMERPSVLFFNQQKKLFYDLIHEFDSLSPRIMNEFLILKRSSSIALDKRTLLEKAMQACEIACYKESPLYTNLETYMLGKYY